MSELSVKNFGLVIAYLLPGFVALWGVSYFSETIRGWLGSPSSDAPTVGGFLYVTLASLVAGMVISAVRWGIVDTVHHLSGLRKPNWDFSTLRNRVDAFDVLVEGHWRYHQFYGGIVVASIFVFAARIFARMSPWPLIPSLGFGLLVLMLWFASRDALENYYERGTMLLGINQSQQRTDGQRSEK